LIGFCFVFLHSPLLLMVSGHLTPKIVLRQRFRKTWEREVDQRTHDAEVLSQSCYCFTLIFSTI
jgi:hypothetical protein